jgi:phosphoadenosine phosphosulfate reductase
VSDTGRATSGPVEVTDIDLAAANPALERQTAEERVAWALDHLKPHLVLSSSFGAQAAVLLHMVTRQWPDIPVVFIDQRASCQAGLSADR